MSPRAFISYSWSSPGHQARIRQWAEQMVSDGVDVVLDVWDLNEGDDKYAFMEKMVTDESVTHVLVFSDSEYAAKADARKAGVGTESQIISREVVLESSTVQVHPGCLRIRRLRRAFLPTFFKSRIWIDFSSPEAANDNWEQLIRVLMASRPTRSRPWKGAHLRYNGCNRSTPAHGCEVRGAQAGHHSGEARTEALSSGLSRCVLRHTRTRYHSGAARDHRHGPACFGGLWEAQARARPHRGFGSCSNPN